MIPAPFEGHLPSMMNLASFLCSKGFAITIVRTQYNFYDISADFPGINFFTIDDGLSESDMSSLGLLDFILELNSLCEPLLKKFLTLKDDFDFIIHDEFVYFPRQVAQDLNLPKMVFSASSAATSISRCMLMENQDKWLHHGEGSLLYKFSLLLIFFFLLMMFGVCFAQKQDLNLKNWCRSFIPFDTKIYL